MSKEFNIETPRLILRHFLPTDEAGMFELGSDPLVYRYLDEELMKSSEEARSTIEYIRQQYTDNGIGRWATIEKSSGNFIGWSGLKFNTTIDNNQTRFYDVGYRFLPRYWGKGYATESGIAAIEYGFRTMKLQEIIGMCHETNLASRRALEKCGLHFIEKFISQGVVCDWLKIAKQDWEERYK